MLGAPGSMIRVPRWEYRVEPLKVTAGDERYVWGDLARYGDDGWELVSIVPLPEPDPKGIFDTTVGFMILKRPKA